LEAEADRVRADTPSIDVSVTVAVGHPAEQILETARLQRADLVVMATNSRTVLGRLVIGSVTDHVVQAAEVPVLVVQPRGAVEKLAPAQLRRLIVPLDGSDVSDRALPVAQGIAAHTGLPIHLVTVADHHRAGMADHLDRVGADLERRGVRASSEVLAGSAVHAIEQASQPGDLVVMASHHRSGVAAWLLRGAAEQLIHGGRVPVLLAPNATSPATTHSPK
jgi:nucleotide-binding universal stress UspA family protein